MSWPKRIFLDTTVLYKLGSRPETNVDLAKLLELASIFKIEIAVPIIAWKEYLRHRRKDLESAHSHVKTAIKEIEKYTDNLSPYRLLVDAIKKLDTNLENQFNQKTAEIGLRLVHLPAVNVEELAEMSLSNAAPFQDSNEKGFRDALIMFTVLEEIKGRPDQQAIFVTEDKRLRAGCESLAPKFNTTLSIVSSLDEARVVVENQVARIHWSNLRAESDEAIRVLSSFETNLSQEVEKTRYLPGGYFLIDQAEHTKIETVRNIRFVKITSALWKEKESTSPRILFKVQCSAEVILREPPPAKTYLIGEPGQQGLRGLEAAMLNAGRFETRSVPFMLFGYADLTHDNGGYALKELKVSPPEVDEMMRLMWLERESLPPS